MWYLHNTYQWKRHYLDNTFSFFCNIYKKIAIKSWVASPQLPALLRETLIWRIVIDHSYKHVGPLRLRTTMSYTVYKGAFVWEYLHSTITQTCEYWRWNHCDYNNICICLLRPILQQHLLLCRLTLSRPWPAHERLTSYLSLLVTRSLPHLLRACPSSNYSPAHHASRAVLWWRILRAHTGNAISVFIQGGLGEGSFYFISFLVMFYKQSECETWM